MAAYYLDSSALVKRYVREIGTAWVRGLMGPSTGNELYVVRAGGVEIIAALFRKARGGLVSLPEAQRAASTFRSHWVQRFVVVEVTHTLVSQAMQLAEKHYLRGYDAIHLAAALQVQQRSRAAGLSPLTFLSADLEQLGAAQAEGLPVDNPDNHP